MGMNADAAPDIVETLGDRSHRLKAAQVGANRHHGADAIGARTRNDIVNIFSKVLEI
jgi:hypothetical protein